MKYVMGLGVDKKIRYLQKDLGIYLPHSFRIVMLWDFAINVSLEDFYKECITLIFSCHHDLYKQPNVGGILKSLFFIDKGIN